MSEKTPGWLGASLRFDLSHPSRTRSRCCSPVNMVSWNPCEK